MINKLWEVREALFWGGLAGLISSFGVMSGILPIYVFIPLSVIMSATLAAATFEKRPGAGA